MASTAAEREGEEGQRDGAGAGSRSTNGIMRTSSGWDGKLRVNKTAKLVIDADTEAMMKQAGAAHAASGAGAGSDSDDDNASEGDKGDSDDGARAKVRSEGKEPLTRAEDDEDLLDDLEPDAEDIDLVHCRISSIPSLRLERFTKVQRLCLRQNAITRPILPPETRASVRDLDLYDNLISHLSALDDMPQLTSLDLSFNKIRHIRHLNRLEQLRDLFFVQNRISQIEGLDNLTKLVNLELGANRIRTIENLDKLAALEQLWLGKNKITEIQGLDCLQNLKILSMPSNRLTHISGLEKLVNLEELHISHNALSSLAGLEANTNIRVLDITANPIDALAGLATLTVLEELWASYCRFSDFAEVERELADKKELNTVYFEGTPLQLRQPVLYRNKVRLALPQIKQIDATFVHL